MGGFIVRGVQEKSRMANHSAFGVFQNGLWHWGDRNGVNLYPFGTGSLEK